MSGTQGRSHQYSNRSIGDVLRRFVEETPGTAEIETSESVRQKVACAFEARKKLHRKLDFRDGVFCVFIYLFSHSFSVSHSHTHTHSLSLSITHPHSLTHSLSLSLSPSLFLALSLKIELKELKKAQNNFSVRIIKNYISMPLSR